MCASLDAICYEFDNGIEMCVQKLSCKFVYDTVSKTLLMFRATVIVRAVCVI